MDQTEPTHRRAPLWRLLVAAAIAITMLGLGTQEARAADAIEQTYRNPPASPWAVTWYDGSSMTTCDPNVAPPGAYTLVFPSALGAFGVNHPVIVWGNGTSTLANPTCPYADELRRLAQRGFVVIAANTGQSGNGDHIRLGAATAINWNSDPSSIFYQNLDVGRIAAAGHSQGAVGAINAVLEAPNSHFASVLAISTPDRDALQIYNDPECDLGLVGELGGCCVQAFGAACVPVPVPPESDMNTLDAPIFFARGALDVISNETDEYWYPSSTTVPYAAASRDGAGHADVSSGRGYLTAWLVYTLNMSGANPATARGAFVGSPPEITTNTNWNDDPVVLRNLP